MHFKMKAGATYSCVIEIRITKKYLFYIRCMFRLFKTHHRCSSQNIEKANTSPRLCRALKTKTKNTEQENQFMTVGSTYVWSKHMGYVQILFDEPAGDSQKPELSINFHMIESLLYTISCTGVVGHPNNILRIVTKQSGESSFRLPPSGNTYRDDDTISECNYQRTVTFQQQMFPVWNLTEVRCFVTNGSISNDNPPSEQMMDGQIVLIDDTYCDGEADETYKFHPKSCGLYIRCVAGVIYSQECSPTLCYNSNSTSFPCISCDDAPHPCD